MPSLIEVLGFVGRISAAAALEAIEAVLYTEKVNLTDAGTARLSLLRNIEAVFHEDYLVLHAIQTALWRLTTRS